MVKSTVILLLVAVLLAGCRVELPSVDDAQQAICTPLQELTVQVGELANLEVDATTSDLKELKAQLDKSVESVRTFNERLNLQPVNDLLDAYANATAEIDTLPDNEPLAEDVIERIRTGVASVQSALDQAASALNCGE